MQSWSCFCWVRYTREPPEDKKKSLFFVDFNRRPASDGLVDSLIETFPLLTDIRRVREDGFPGNGNTGAIDLRHFPAFLALTFALVFSARWSAAQTAPAQGAGSEEKPTLFIVGDSTAHINGKAENGPNKRVGWGTPFARYFNPAKIRVVNAAAAGRSSRTFMQEGKWAAVEAQLRPGDFVLINFGHNDPGAVATGKARGSLPGIGEETQQVTGRDGKTETVHTFGWYLRRYIADTRAKGATPIVLSVTPRNIWTNRKIEMGLGHFRRWAEEVAQQENVDYVDLTGIAGRGYEKLGPQKVKAFFPLDHTHTDLAGAEFVARCVVEGLKSLPDSPFTPYFSQEGEAVVSATEASLPLPKNPSLPTLWIIGDSTVRNGEGNGANGQWGWGDEIAEYFNTNRLNVVNRAVGGRSSRTYYHFHWPTVLGMIHKGDFVLMQFGHNDSGPLDDKARARGTLPGNGPETRAIFNPITRQHEVVHTYGWYLRQMIDEARSKGATPIVCSLIPRKIWVDGRIRREDYVEWAAEAAREEYAPFVNLNEIIAEQYDRMGPAAVNGLFGDPHTHTNLQGAQLNAKSVIEGLRGLHRDPLKGYFSTEGRAVKGFPQKAQMRALAHAS